MQLVAAPTYSPRTETLSVEQRDEVRRQLRRYLGYPFTAGKEESEPLLLPLFWDVELTLPAAAVADDASLAYRRGLGPNGSLDEQPVVRAMRRAGDEASLVTICRPAHVSVPYHEVARMLDSMPTHLASSLRASVVRRKGDTWLSVRWHTSRQQINGWVQEGLDVLADMVYGDRWLDRSQVASLRVLNGGRRDERAA
jgi:hypothetical protein